MPIDRNISFRNHLFGSVEDFVASTGMQPLVTSRTVAHLVVALAHYTEEGKSLSPEMYITTDVEKLMQFLPGSSCLPIGECQLSEEAPNVALKHCAPLAIEGWCIYVSSNSTKVSYGIFRDALSPLAIPLDEAVLATGGGSAKILRVHQSAPSCVDIANHRGDRHTIFLSQRPEQEPSPRKHVDSLISTICSELPDELIEPTRTVVRRAINSGLEASHGALIAVTRSDKSPKFLSDGLVFGKPLNFGSLVKNAASGTEDERLKLLSYTSVIRGIMGCDGIVVFNRKATLLGYNCFIKPTKSTPTPSSGGARKRAFAALKGRIGRGLFATFIRSHDGWSDFESL
jgi:hypothetical protein